MNPNNTRGRLKYQRAELPLAPFNEERGSSIVSFYKLPVEVDTKCFDWTMISQIPTIRWYDDDECPFVVAKMFSTRFIATINYSPKLLYKEKKTSNPFCKIQKNHIPSKMTD